MTQEWIKKSDRPPTEADCDALGCILVWHVYQGAMVYGRRNSLENEFMTHWMRTPEAPKEYQKRKSTP